MYFYRFDIDLKNIYSKFYFFFNINICFLNKFFSLWLCYSFACIQNSHYIDFWLLVSQILNDFAIKSVTIRGYNKREREKERAKCIIIIFNHRDITERSRTYFWRKIGYHTYTHRRCTWLHPFLIFSDKCRKQRQSATNSQVIIDFYLRLSANQ